MRKRTTNISIRINSDIDKLLDAIAKQFNLTKTDIIKYFIESSLISNNFDNKLSKELKRRVSLVMIRSNRTEITNNLYIIKNMYQRIVDLAMSSYFTTGTVNMEIINKVIDMFVNEFNHYPKDDQIILQSDFDDAVTHLRNKDNILEHADKMQKLMWKKK